MLRIIVLLMFAGCIYALDIPTDAQIAKQVQEFAHDINQYSMSNSILSQQIQEQAQDNNPKLIVFVSTSMSHKSIQQWAQQAELLGAELVIRGFVNNSFKETIALAQELFSKNNVGGFNIDPAKFKKYAIEIVPTVVLHVGGNIDYVQGDIGLIEALKIIRNKGENSISAQSYLVKI